jgi:hypothetical protein
MFSAEGNQETFQAKAVRVGSEAGSLDSEQDLHSYIVTNCRDESKHMSAVLLKQGRY